MQKLLFIIVAASLHLPSAFASEKNCSCKCVTKDDEGKYKTAHGSGEDREKAGEDLKKKLGSKSKCELSPVCEGSC